MNEQKILDALRYVGRYLRRTASELEKPQTDLERNRLHERTTETSTHVEDALDEFRINGTPVSIGMTSDPNPEYVPYGKEWEEEMMNYGKSQLIDMLRKEWKKNNA